jgi:N6-L-threonylcarbamoyladenine synthase
MLILGLESSCDETAAALVRDGQVLGEVVRSQADLHARYGGVVPEIANRAHLEAVSAIVDELFARSGLGGFGSLDGLAVTQGPGLVGALLVALTFAKGVHLATGLPVVGVNHVKAHALAPFMTVEGGSPLEPQFPLAALVASGGHTSLFLMRSLTDFAVVGRTRDDAAGEAFDKTAKLMGLGYPGGRILEKMAEGGDPQAFKIVRPMLREGLDFSFSGLKTQIRTIYAQGRLDDEPADSQALKDLAASFQAAVVEVLEEKLVRAVKAHGAKGAVLAGGVAANGALRRALGKRLGELEKPLFAPKPAWCTDNAAMIGFLGELQMKEKSHILDLRAEPRPSWPVDAA